MKITQDFFSAPKFWRVDPVKAFESFVASKDFTALSHRGARTLSGAGRDKKEVQPVRAGTARVYNAMWARFSGWLAKRGKTVFSASSADLTAFLELRDEDGNRILEGATVRRQYLSLCERVFKLLEISPNPAQQVCHKVHDEDRNLAGKNDQMAVLTMEQLQAFIAAMPADDDPGPDGWKVRRDHALQALILGSGVRPGQAVRIRIENVFKSAEDGAWSVDLSPGATGGVDKPRVVPIKQIAVPIIRSWWEERQAIGIPGKLLFPSSEKGDWVKTPKGRRSGALNKSSVFRQIRQTFQRAGIEMHHLGARTLRNTYAVTELLAGVDPGTLTERLGLYEVSSIEPYIEAAARGRVTKRRK